MALKLAEMNAFLQKRQAEDEHLQEEIQDAFKDLNKSVQSSYVASFSGPPPSFYWTITCSSTSSGELGGNEGNLMRIRKLVQL